MCHEARPQLYELQSTSAAGAHPWKPQQQVSDEVSSRRLNSTSRQALVLTSLSPRRLHTDRSANLQTVSCSAAPGISTEVPAWGKDFDIGTFATANPASISDVSPPDTSWIRPVWDALKPASAAAICVVARAVGGKGAIRLEQSGTR